MGRLPIIRHIRYWILRYRVERWAWTWGQAGIGLGYPNEADLRQLDRVWRGEA